ncbi:MAG: riboflavin synthase [Oscillospiraceae bacterium]|nr:riboflavin synthase [Oscillospiraceae bacterium]
MFTGIVEEIGTVKKIARGQKAYLEIQADKIFSDIHIGDSIAVNGVCLTVTGFSGKVFTADVMNETFSRSSLGSLKAGSHVNLERAMSANGRFGGHIVSGHIDGTGKITNIKKDGNAVWYKISASENIIKYTVEKGSIAIDGISLTVARIEKDNFSVSIIPHTSEETILSEKKVGDTVNLENDIIGKYVERFLNFDKTEKSDITRDFLAKYGF